MNFHLKEWVKTVCPVKSCFRSLNPDSCLKKRGGVYMCHTLKKDMETHSNILAWRIPWTEELCGL